MPPLSRPVVAAWAAAAVLALLPTWWYWQEWLDAAPDTAVYGMVRQFTDARPTPVLAPLLGDIGSVVMLAYAWAFPAALVAAGFLGRLRQGDPEAVARRVAWGLVAVAVAGPVTGVDWMLPVLSLEWFAAVAACWGPTQVCYLLAAVLVLVASLDLPRRPGPVAEGLGLRAAALLADYVIFCTALGLVLPLLYEGERFLRVPALLSRLEPGTLPVGDDLAVLGLLFLYVWIPRGTTAGKRLLGLRVEGAGPGKAALRALLFPVAVLWPTYGVLWPAADVLWSFVDGRTLHDRLLGTSVRVR